MKTNERKMKIEQLEQEFISLYGIGSDLCYSGKIDVATHILYALEQIDSAINNLKYAKDNEK